MNDDELLQALGRLARERQNEADDARWRALTHGELSAEEEAALRREAAESRQARRQLDAFEPLGAEARARIASRLREELRAPEEPATHPSPGAGGTRLPWRLSGRWWVGSLAAAAAFCAVMLWPAAELPPMPAYALSVEGALASSRAGDSAAAGAPVRLAPGRRFALVLRPATAVEGPVAVRAFLGRDGRWTRWQIEPRIAPSGAVRVDSAVANDSSPRQAGLLPAGAGNWQLALAVGRRGRLPDDAAVAAAAAAGRSGAADWVLLQAGIVIEPDPHGSP